MKRIPIPKNFFSADDIQDLTQRLDIGVVHFWYLYKDPEDHDGDTLREAFGTRNMLMSFIEWSDIPMDLKTPPEHVRTYFDTQRNAWRCFIKDNLVKYQEQIFVDDSFGEDDINALPISEKKKNELFAQVKTFKR